MDQIPAIARVFAYLSLLTIGGGMAAYPEMKSLVVDVHHWLTDAQVIHIYSVGQMAPGPNMMMVAAMGERISGLAGAAVAALAFFVPTGILTFGVGRAWTRLANWPWRDADSKGPRPRGHRSGCRWSRLLRAGLDHRVGDGSDRADRVCRDDADQNQSCAAHSRRSSRRRYRTAIEELPWLPQSPLANSSCCSNRNCL